MKAIRLKNIRILLIAALCVVLVFLALVGSFFAPRLVLMNRLDSLECETDDLPAYVCERHILYAGGKSLDFDEVRAALSFPGELAEVLLVKNGRVWFVLDEKDTDGWLWHLCSIGLDGTAYQLHFSGKFCVETGAEPYYREHKYSQTDYYESNGFYADGKIFLTDRLQMVIYDMATETAVEVPYDASLLPKAKRCVEIDGEGLKVTDNGVAYRLDKDALCAGSAAFAKLAEWGEAPIWNKEKAGQYLFDGVQCDGENGWIFCRLLNYGGETHTVIFCYDFENERVSYCCNSFMGDVIGRRMYIVPTL